MKTAITREVSSAFASCELTFIDREPIDLDLARRQHKAYEAALGRLGVRVVALPEEPTLADSVFVEDTAVVLNEIAVITRPGAVSRRPETSSIAETLSLFRPLVHLAEPYTLDGGDVLVVDKTIYIGITSRTDRDSVFAFQALVEPYGYLVRAVPVEGCLHLKSAATLCTPDMLLLHPARIDKAHFKGLHFLEIDLREPHAANGVLVGESLIYPTGFPRTLEKLETLGIQIETVDISELAKAEGAVTCCSLLFDSA